MSTRNILRQCINTHTSREFDDSTDLFTSGILSSLQVMELLLVIESQCGRRLTSQDINRHHLCSIDAMMTHFFPTQQAVQP